MATATPTPQIPANASLTIMEESISQPDFSTTASKPNVKVGLTIPLDEELATSSKVEGPARRNSSGRTILRRDSMKRREALVKGKEGSRRRQRWENDHMINNPYAHPPEKGDWEVRPVYMKKTVRYEIAQLWEHPTFRKTVVKPNERLREKAKQARHIDGVPKQLKDRLKKSGRGAVGMLMHLEEEVRRFIQGVSRKESVEDDDYVMVEKEDLMDEQPNEKRLMHKPVLETEESDPSATFGRWLVHSIAKYYGLHSWSETIGENPTKRIAYVAIVPSPKKANRRKSVDAMDIDGQECFMPKPLYGMLGAAS